MSGSVSTKEEYGLTGDRFERLLAWLDSDRDRAGQRYEEIRLQLIKIFVSRGCLISEELADRTIDRVARKLSTISNTYCGDPALYFYGVAKVVFFEYVRREPAVPHVPSIGPVQDDEQKYECLQQCVGGLTPRNRELILLYYGDEQLANEDRRKELAKRMGLEPNALWVRAHRIRERLKTCVDECLKRT
jgi:DNA-directed RNA polymerase specialized sigma24 family protein